MMSVMTMPARVAESSSTQFWHTAGKVRPEEEGRVLEIREPSLPLRAAPGALISRPKLGTGLPRALLHPPLTFSLRSSLRFVGT